MLFFFPRGVLDEILNLIESVSKGFPSYFSVDSCDTGYTGNPSVNEIICQDSGDWSDVTGCTIVG